MVTVETCRALKNISYSGHIYGDFLLYIGDNSGDNAGNDDGDDSGGNGIFTCIISGIVGGGVVVIVIGGGMSLLLIFLVKKMTSTKQGMLIRTL